MKKLFAPIIIILLLLPLSSNARVGWGFSNYSLFYGGLYHLQGGYMQNVEILYDRSIRSCVSRTPHFGIGANVSFNSNYSEFGLKGLYNPTRITYWFSRNLHLFPYIYAQANYSVSNLDQQDRSYYGFRPGVGIITNNDRGTSMFRLLVQIGYNFNAYSKEVANGLSVELKLGIGINHKRWKASRNTPEEKS